MIIDKKITSDEVTLIDLDDNVISTIDKYEAHKHPTKLHRAVSVWLINNKGQILLQKRSTKKIVGSKWWANAICGNVRPTESYLQCATRRLEEEIGVKVAEIKPIYRFLYKAYCNEKYGEYELDQVYLGKYDGIIVPNLDEVNEVSWIDFKELIKCVSNTVSSEKTLVMNLEQLKISTTPCKIKISKKNEIQFLAPWTHMMLSDPRLIKAITSL